MFLVLNWATGLSNSLKEPSVSTLPAPRLGDGSLGRRDRASGRPDTTNRGAPRAFAGSHLFRHTPASGSSDPARQVGFSPPPPYNTYLGPGRGFEAYSGPGAPRRVRLTGDRGALTVAGSDTRDQPICSFLTVASVAHSSLRTCAQTAASVTAPSRLLRLPPGYPCPPPPPCCRLDFAADFVEVTTLLRISPA